MSIYKDTHEHIMAQEKVTEYEPNEEQIDAVTPSKYGAGIMVENKGHFVFEQST